MIMQVPGYNSRERMCVEATFCSSRHSVERKEKITPFGVNLMRSQVLYWAAQGLRGIKIVLARPIVPPIASSLQRISAAVL